MIFTLHFFMHKLMAQSLLFGTHNFLHEIRHIRGFIFKILNIIFLDL